MKYKLCDVTKSANTGADAIKRAPIVEENTGLRCLRIGDVSQKRSFNEWGYTKTTEDDYKRYKLEQNDIIIARTGNTIGVNCFIENDIESVYNNGLIRIKADTDKIIPKFMYYIIRSQDCQNFVQSIAYGTSTQPNMKIQEFLNFEFEYYNKDVQSKIVSIIDNIDKKIELNYSINNNLEQQAQAIYSNFIDNCDTQIIKVSDITATANTGADAIQKAPIVDYDTGVKCIRVGDMSNNRDIYQWGYSKVTDEVFKQYQLKKDDILVTRTATLGLNRLITSDLNAIYNNGLIRLTVDKSKIYPLFLYRQFQTSDFFNFINRIESETSVRPNMKINYLLGYEFECPKIDKQKELIELLIPLMNLIEHNSHQNNRLIQLRDTLLPKLMSGEIDVSNVDISTDKLSFSEK